jgi:hypothetical protein
MQWFEKVTISGLKFASIIILENAQPQMHFFYQETVGYKEVHEWDFFKFEQFKCTFDFCLLNNWTESWYNLIFLMFGNAICANTFHESKFFLRANQELPIFVEPRGL